MKRKTIAIDMDNVIADIESNWINWYHKEFGVLVSHEAMKGIPEDQAFPDPLAARSLLYKPDFFRTPPLMEGAQEALLKLQEHFDIFIVSAAMEFPNSLIEKYEWLNEHFPFIHWKNIVLCGDKRIIDTDYLVDDHLKNLDFCKGTPIMFTAGHNILIQKHLRVNSWAEALEYFAGELSTIQE